MRKDSKIYIAGHKGLIGSAILKALQKQGYENFVLKTHSELDLTRQDKVEEFFNKERPEYVFFCAARVGGMIDQIKHRGSFLYENLIMQSNVIHNAYKFASKKLLFLSSFCIYPQCAELPIKENALFKGELQANNEPYGVAKIAGTRMCEYYSLEYNLDFLSVAPVSVYGDNDRFDFISSHVQAAIFRKIYLAKLLNEKNDEALLKDMKLQDINEAKALLKKYNITEDKIILLGTGRASREFLHADDLANACVFFMQNTSFKDCLENGKNSQINVGTGELVSIKELAFLLKEILEYKGELCFENKAENDGTLEKLADCSKAKHLGFEGAKIPLKDGLKQMYEAYLKNH